MLLPSFHIGWNCSSGCQALETLVGVIDKNPVFVLVVSLWVVACCHWENIEEMELSFGTAEFVFIQNTGCGIRQNVSKGKNILNTGCSFVLQPQERTAGTQDMAQAF